MAARRCRKHFARSRPHGEVCCPPRRTDVPLAVRTLVAHTTIEMHFYLLRALVTSVGHTICHAS
jgi:hypothetical protein